VAEPLPIAWAVQRAPVAERVRLAAVVTLVDATHFRASRPVSVAVDAQVAYADVLLVTKAPLAGAAETAAVVGALRALAPRALIREGTTDEHASWLEQALADPSLERPEAPTLPAGDNVPHDHGAHDHDSSQCRHPDTHAHGVDSLSLEVQGVLDLEELEDQLAELPANYVRIKGIVRAVDGRREEDTPAWVAIHRVGLRVSSEPLVRKPDEFSGDRGRLVALGSALAREELDLCVRAARLEA